MAKGVIDCLALKPIVSKNFIDLFYWNEELTDRGSLIVHLAVMRHKGCIVPPLTFSIGPSPFRTPGLASVLLACPTAPYTTVLFPATAAGHN